MTRAHHHADCPHDETRRRFWAAKHVLDARVHASAGGITAGNVRRHRDPKPPWARQRPASRDQRRWFGPKLPVSNLTLLSSAAQNG